VPPEWDRYGTCALASSAFPIGLAPRHLAAPIDGYLQRSYPVTGGAYAISPSFPPDETAEFAAPNVDGGLINNNPFDYAQFTLMGDASAEKTDGAEADRAVIMVAPFPEPPAFLPKGQPIAELLPVVRALFPALINQARFKVGELVPALDPADHSRFLMRRIASSTGKRNGIRSPAGCSAVSVAFSMKSFGRTISSSGGAIVRHSCVPLLACRTATPSSPASAVNNSSASRQIWQPGSQRNTRSFRFWATRSEVPLPYWPRMSQADFELLLVRIKRRLAKIAPLLVQSQTTSPLLRSIGYLGLFFAKRRVREFIRFAILSDLIRRDQIDGWDLPPNLAAGGADDVRAVLAELASPNFAFRTTAGITTKTHLQLGFVEGVLRQLSHADENKPFRVWQGQRDGKQVFTLESRKPKGFWSLPGIRQFGDWLEAPAIS
jgi:hypothetical protein